MTVSFPEPMMEPDVKPTCSICKTWMQLFRGIWLCGICDKPRHRICECHFPSKPNV